MVKVLMVAEKPSISLSLAQIISKGQYKSRSGKSSFCPVHEFTGQFKGQQAWIKITSVVGHVYGLDFPPQFQNKDTLDPFLLFTADTEKREANPQARVVSHLKHEAKGCDYLVLWLDCDREGENICFEVIGCVKRYLNQVSGTQIFRARFSALSAIDIQKALNNLVSPSELEAKAVDARQEIDLKVGVAFSRFQTKFFHGKYINLDSRMITYGPCQTPTLGFCVTRHDEIQQFTPEMYWVVSVTIGKNAERVNLEWERGRVFDQAIGNFFLSLVKSSPKVELLSYATKEGRRSPPLPLNTVDLLKIASKQLGIGPHQTMKVAEHLYTSGYISYPRTETTKYPEHFDIRSTLSQQKSNPYWGGYVADLLSTGFKHRKSGKDVGDHPPITPMKGAEEGELTGDMWRIYDYVTRHFIASVSASTKFLKSKAIFKIAGETFKCSGIRTISEGFVSIMPWSKSSEEQIPDFNLPGEWSISDASLKQLTTSPPGYLTESELISLMEKHGIGTDASISVHINTICTRNYVTVQGNNRTLVPNPIGISLVHGYFKIDPELALPIIRSSIEKYVDLIALGKASYEEVVSHSLEVFKQKYLYFVKKIAKMDELFESNFSTIQDSEGKFQSKCGKCNRFMKFLNFNPSRLYCPQCDEVYLLPQMANVKLYMEIKCPLDNFELVLVSFGKNKSYPVCPYCYNYPPYEGIPTGMGCNKCTNPSCKYSMVKTAVWPCPECEEVKQINDKAKTDKPIESGTLIFDLISKPNWRLNCNVCQYALFFATGAHKITLKNKKCEDCGSTEMTVDFDKKDSPLPNGETLFTGCLFCDDVLRDTIKEGHSKSKHPMFMRRGGGRKGRGKRGKKRGGRM